MVLSHPLQDVVSDRPVHTSWALFVPGMWSPSNRSQQLSLCNGKRRISESQGGAGTASILLLPYHLHHGAAATCICTQRRHDNMQCAHCKYTGISGHEQSMTLIMQQLIYKYGNELFCPNCGELPCGGNMIHFVDS